MSILIQNKIGKIKSQWIYFSLFTPCFIIFTAAFLGGINLLVNDIRPLQTKEYLFLLGYPLLIIFQIHHVLRLFNTKDFELGEDWLRLPSPRITRENSMKYQRFIEPKVHFADIQNIKILQNEDRKWIELSEYNKSEKVIGLKIITKTYKKEYTIIDFKHYPLNKTIEYFLNNQAKVTNIEK